MVVGADGDIWITDISNDTVLRLDPATGANRPGYPIPTGSHDPLGMVAGADGDIWITHSANFLDPNDDNVSRIDPATGTVRPGYPILTGGEFPSGIMVGADGDIWIANQIGRNVSRIDPAAATNRPGYPIATGDLPIDIARGLDGDMWITLSASLGSTGNRIARIDPATGTNRQGYPTAIAGPVGSIAVGTDGSVWIDNDSGPTQGIARMYLLTGLRASLTATIDGPSQVTVTATVHATDMLEQANGVTVTLSLPAGLSIIQTTEASVSGSGGVTFGPFALAHGATRTITVRASKSPDVGVLAIIGVVAWLNPDPLSASPIVISTVVGTPTFTG
jgi:streptogramin lyase